MNRSATCSPGQRSLASGGQNSRTALPAMSVVSAQLILTWVQPLDDRTISDLFGRQFTTRFLAYRLCLANSGSSSPGSRRIIYLIQDALRVPVTITGSNGDALSPAQINELSNGPQFAHAGFSKIGDSKPNPDGGRDCKTVNAWYQPVTSDQMLERKVDFQLGSLEISRRRVVKLNGFQRRNIQTYVLKTLERLSPGQAIERILAVPEQETLGSQTIKVVPCLKYFQFGIVWKDIP